MTQGIWGLYKARVLQTLGGARADGALQEEGEPSELMEAAEPPAVMEEGPGPVSQLARKVQGGWRTFSSLFTREDEHQLLNAEPCADHPNADCSYMRASGLDLLMGCFQPSWWERRI